MLHILFFLVIKSRSTQSSGDAPVKDLGKVKLSSSQDDTKQPQNANSTLSLGHFPRLEATSLLTRYPITIDIQSLVEERMEPLPRVISVKKQPLDSKLSLTPFALNDGNNLAQQESEAVHQGATQIPDVELSGHHTHTRNVSGQEEISRRLLGPRLLANQQMHPPFDVLSLGKSSIRTATAQERSAHDFNPEQPQASILTIPLASPFHGKTALSGFGPKRSSLPGAGGSVQLRTPILTALTRKPYAPAVNPLALPKAPHQLQLGKKVTCADKPCFSGVPCKPTEDRGFKCGSCPLGYTGDGIRCQGKRVKNMSVLMFHS